MAYKDKEKQREANRERQRRYKARHKGVTSEGVTVTPNLDIREGYDEAKIQGMIEDVRKNGGEYSFKTIKGEVQDVHHTKACTGVVTGKPGDEGYNGVCTEAWRAERGR